MKIKTIFERVKWLKMEKVVPNKQNIKDLFQGILSYLFLLNRYLLGSTLIPLWVLRKKPLINTNLSRVFCSKNIISLLLKSLYFQVVTCLSSVRFFKKKNMLLSYRIFSYLLSKNCIALGISINKMASV